MPLFPKSKFLRGLFNHDAELGALDKEIAAAADITEPGERLLRYDVLAKKSSNMSLDVVSLKLLGLCMLPLVSGVVLTIGALTTGAYLLAAAAAALAGGSVYVTRQIGCDAIEAADRRAGACRAAAQEITDSTPLKAFALSPRFENVMNSFPRLREKFILAAAREKMTPAAELSLASQAARLKL